MADLEGITLDRYELEELLGRGGMADVYVAYDPRFGRQVAIKVFKREDEDLLRRFVREAQLMASLNNAHLVPVYDTGSARHGNVNIYYIVMPLMKGGTLRARIRRNPVPIKQACTYIREIADALDYIHSQGIIHRDIKASNVLLDAEGRCYLSDFGIARAASESTQLTTTGNVLGTVDYIAPELFESDRRADESSDLYSFGVLLYEMVTGHLPFSGENPIAVVTMHINNTPPSPRKYIPDLPAPVEQVLMRALEKRPEARYASASALAEAFCRAANTKQTRKIPAVEPLPVSTGRSAAATPTTVRRQNPPTNVSRVTNRQQAVPGSYAPQAPAYSYYDPQPDQAHYPLSAQQERRSHGPAGFVTALVIIALLAVIGAATFVLVNNGQLLGRVTPAPTATPDVQATANAATATVVQQSTNTTATAIASAQQATATAHAQATATVQARQQATATARAQATATVVAQATATAGVIATATAGKPTYSDPLTDANNPSTQAAQWQTNDGCSFSSDGYHVRATLLSSFKICQETGQQFSNVTAQVEVTILKGHSGGLFFRLNPGQLGGTSGYLFEIDTEGNYKISSSDAFNVNTVNVLHDWTASSALKTGNQKNLLQVIAHNGTLLFYANGVYLPTPIQDTTYSKGGIGFLATSNQGETTDVVYRNVNVYPQ